MGIRFKCPNGHKINVKAFLAGKRAFCPDCGAKVVVPLESQETATASAPAATVAGNGAAAAQNAAAEQAAVKQTTLPQGVPARATAAPVSVRSGGPTSPSFGAELSAAAAAVSTPVVAAPSPVLGATGSASAIGDPIAEAPQAVWYVRPRSGGQFGPAPGDIFRQWIAQRRVTADSLVWRDGWTDWRLAAEVLPQLATKPAPAFAGMAGTAMPASAAGPAAASGPNATASRYVKSRRSKSSTVVAICILGLVAIALVGVLIWVLLNRP